MNRRPLECHAIKTYIEYIITAYFHRKTVSTTRFISKNPHIYHTTTLDCGTFNHKDKLCIIRKISIIGQTTLFNRFGKKEWGGGQPPHFCNWLQNCQAGIGDPSFCSRIGSLGSNDIALFISDERDS